ncbi:MAG: DUF6701 domain-containing protein [Idiomarina sp.]
MQIYKLLVAVVIYLAATLYSPVALGATYLVPAGPLPPGCSYDGSEVLCNGNLIFGNNDTINVSSPTTLRITGDFTFGNNFVVNENGNTNDLNIIVEGNMNPSNNGIINANLTVEGSINSGNNTGFTGGLIVSGNLNLGNNSTVTGNIQVDGTLNTGQNITIDGNIDATNVNIGQNNTINGNIEAENVNINGSNSVINGDVDATNSVNNNGTINGDVDSPNVNDNGDITGDQCDQQQEIEDEEDRGCDPEGNVEYFQLTHSGTALTCEAYPVTVTACADAGCTSQFAFTGTVDIAESGSGFDAVTANFSASSQATVNLAIPTVGNYQLVTQNPTGEVPASGVQCDSVNGCTITAVDTALRFTNEQSQVAGVSFSLGLEAIRTDTNTGACGAALQGSQNVQFALSCQNPGTCSNTSTYPQAALSINSTTVGTAATAVPVTFDSNGAGTLSVNYGDVGSIALSASTQAPTSATLSGNSAPFVVKPHAIGFTINSNPAAGLSSDFHLANVFARAGENFEVRLTALNFNGDATPNFGNETTAQSLALVNHSLLAPSGSGANTGTLANMSGFSASSAIAEYVNSSLNFSEVGVIQLEANVVGGDYLGAGGINNVANRTSAPLGRFIPAYFEVLPQTPVLVHAQDDFTYYGQPTEFGLNPQWELRAYSAAGALTTNYRDLFYRLTNDGSTDANRFGTTATSNLANVSASLTGTATLQVTNQSNLGQPLDLQLANLAMLFSKPQVPKLPEQAAYNITVPASLMTDSDGVCIASQAAPGNCQEISLSNSLTGEAMDMTGTELLDGVIVLNDSYGVDGEPLPVDVIITAYTSVGGVEAYRVNTRDNSTAVTTAWLTNLACAGNTLNAVGNTTVSGGRTGNSFIVAGAATPCEAFWQPNLIDQGVEYLRSWNSTNTSWEDPAATLYFGRFRGNDRIIFTREIGW